LLSKYDPSLQRQPAPLLKKLDESVIEEAYARVEGWEGSRELGGQGRCPGSFMSERCEGARPRLLAVAAVSRCSSVG